MKSLSVGVRVETNNLAYKHIQFTNCLHSCRVSTASECERRIQTKSEKQNQNPNQAELRKCRTSLEKRPFSAQDKLTKKMARHKCKFRK
ncbi:uncharacterized protein Dmoj_GI25963 [Drosophila mojavensis]|uniref:Uncharacterized protein n=1 Tax=Drosophila mojavensis TaxID=7230 RepID=A0A0Q9X586_DROMO|nr:uncharacterized protein Dmoj_GI25963 [Drosophila mojavensis]